MKIISIVRNRGQLTIPGSVRRLAPWVDSLAAVTISLTGPEEIVIKPHKSGPDWRRVWAGINQVRALRGSATGSSAAGFLSRDRRSH